ncbi:hypothetical protein WMY93_013237 [Mugilogobius chulae]|uniref:Uncharacterized protein n=1 Tax=Mugilogobius chulae TaxID=88201 RepID=A0AAW0NZD1_9GOBI
MELMRTSNQIRLRRSSYPRYIMADWKIMVSGAADQCNEILTERRPDKTPERRHVNILLDLSEEEITKDLHPYEYRCNQGWEEAVCGWERVAPLTTLLLAEKTDNKPKHKETERDSSTSLEPDSDLTSETQMRPPTGSRPSQSSQNTWAINKHNESNPTPEIPEIPPVEGISRTTANLVMGDQTRDTRTPFQHQQVIPQCNLAGNRSPKTRKNSLKTNNALVPIKNFTFYHLSICHKINISTSINKVIRLWKTFSLLIR